MLTLLRRFRHRAGSTVALLIVGTFAVGAVVIGPIYNSAAKQSILRDSLASASVLERTLETTRYGTTGTDLQLLQAEVGDALPMVAHSERTEILFRSAALDLETKIFLGPRRLDANLVWRTGYCATLPLAAGRCPTSAGQVMISQADELLTGLKVGRGFPASHGTPAITVVGIYRNPDPSSSIWYDHGDDLFPLEVPCSSLSCSSPGFDAFITPQSTLAELPAKSSAEAVLDLAVNINRTLVTDLPLLARVGNQLPNDGDLVDYGGVNVQASLPYLAEQVRSSWRLLGVPIVILDTELLVVTWLLLFFMIAEASEARAAEVALTKLRGFPRRRTARFAATEPTLLLALSLPIGVLLGWLGARVMVEESLLPGTATHLVGRAWEVGALAVVGGLAAVAVGLRSTLSRSVIDHWRRTKRGNSRSWIIDAILITAAVAGAAQLVAGGALSNTRNSPDALLVPGLIGIAIAVTGSRLLPVLARSALNRTRSAGGLGSFLAVRHISRRPAGMRTAAVLATALALATFGLSSWAVGQQNRNAAADLTVGAPTVLTVFAPTGVDLPTLVDRLDPSGDKATAVDMAATESAVTLAVQPARFARIAAWKYSGIGDVSTLVKDLSSTPVTPLNLSNSVRITLEAGASLSPSVVDASIDIVVPGDSGPVSMSLGRLRAGQSLSRSVSLPSVAQLRDIRLLAIGSVQRTSHITVSGQVTVSSIQTGGAGHTSDVAGALGEGLWDVGDAANASVTSSSSGLAWQADGKGGQATLLAHGFPARLPAVTSSALGSQGRGLVVSGLGGSPLPVTVSTPVRNVPGAPADGAVVSIDAASAASYGELVTSQEQVWIAGDPGSIITGLDKAGVKILDRQSSNGLASSYGRQGPGLATDLFLADAAAAALLAAFGAILSLTTSARRRRYEYAALATAGVGKRSLTAGLVIEQFVIVGFAALTGVIAGLLSVALVEHDVPEFVTKPFGVTLSYRPSTELLAVTLIVGIIVILTIASVSARSLLRSIGSDRLRSGPG